MKSGFIENTLFLGNGFCRSVFRNTPSWKDLFEATDDSIDNYTFLYEAYRLNPAHINQEEDVVKASLVQKINSDFSGKNIREDICGLENFGKLLSQHHVNNIITTNYDEGIEFILCDICGYQEQEIIGAFPERIYSIRTHKEFHNDKTGHNVKLWKIHGDVSRIKSIMVGFDQYCGSLAKMLNYVKGKYKSEQLGSTVCCDTTIEEKGAKQEYDNISWIELFFRTNVYIVGFGMALSEIDVWWLLNKRARFLPNVPGINNKIVYLYNNEYENEKTAPDIFASLRAFHVCRSPIMCDRYYINNIFESMSKTQKAVLDVIKH